MKKIIALVVGLMFAFCGWLILPGSAKADHASTTWTKYSGNPVFATPGFGFPRVIKDGNTYRLWVEAVGGGLEYLTSADGITWTSAGETTGDGNVHEATIIKDDDTFKMWYNKVTATGYRTSTDGRTWGAETEVSYNVTEAWDADRICPVVIKDDDTYKMWYNANEGVGKHYIAYAYSSDGVSWTEPQNLGQVADASDSTQNNLVLKQGNAGEWDGWQAGETLYSLTVLKNSTGTYEMWYTGGGGTNYAIGYADSSDGISWTKSPDNPVLNITPGDWDANEIMYPSVVEDTNGYKMWYWDGILGVTGNSIGLAEAEIIEEAAPPEENGDENGEEETVQETAEEEELPATGADTSLLWLTVITITIFTAGILTLPHLHHKK